MDKVLIGIYEEKTKDNKGQVIPNPVFIGPNGLPTNILEVGIASVEDNDNANAILEGYKSNYISQRIKEGARIPDKFVIKTQGEEVVAK